MNVVRKRPTETRKQIAARYAALGREHQAIFLARLGDRLSLMARETYAQGDGASDGTRLRAFNEAQNRILGQLVRLPTSGPARYPDDVFANILMDQFQTLKIDPAQIFGVCWLGEEAPPP
jgi:hypothetical protein